MVKLKLDIDKEEIKNIVSSINNCHILHLATIIEEYMIDGTV